MQCAKNKALGYTKLWYQFEANMLKRYISCMKCFIDFQGILQDKDKRIYELQEQILKLRDQLIAANVDSDKTSVAMLTKVKL